MVETVTITIELAEVVGEPAFEFVAWSAIERRDIVPISTDGEKYEPGTTVKVKHKVKNIGDKIGVATIKVTDAYTGAYITTYGSGVIIPPGGTWRIDDMEIGKMPNKDWRLKFKVAP